MVVFCPWSPPPRHRINIKTAKLFATGPAPGAATAGADHKGTFALQAACKNVVAGGILESPSTTPGTLLCICRHLLAICDKLL